MIELIPKQNYFVSHRAIDELPDVKGTEAGFLSCNIIPEHPVKVEDQKIPLNDVKSILEPLALSFHDKITSGYSTTTYKVDNTVAWGFERFGIFVEGGQETIRSIWLCSSAKFSTDNSGQTFKKALLALANELGLILVDWNREIIVDIAKERKLNNYLADVLVFDITG